MFDKNLEQIEKINFSLKRRLQRISSVESRFGISYCVTNSGDYILLKDDIPCDDLNNPREAVKKSLQTTIKNEMKSNDFIITFGIGLGYLLDEVFNKYSSKIYVYEPDLNLLHFVLSNVDISEHLSSGRIFITNDLQELITHLSSAYLTKDKVEIVYLQNYAVVKNKELLLLTQKVYESCKSKMVDVNTITKFSKYWLNNTLCNISYANNNKVYLLSDLENKYSGKTALILGAGPSLNDNIDKIKAKRESFVIFAVNKVVKYLVEKNVIPDYIVCLDAGNMLKTLGGIDAYLSHSNCIMDIRADRNLTKLEFKKIFYSFSDTDFVIKKIAKCNKEIAFWESGGSAMTLALTAAIKLGFSKIVTAGLDLAFKDNVIYSSGESIQRVSQEEIIVDNVRKNLVQVKSVNGGMVYTREDYATFIHHFETLIKELKYKEIYNVTTFGAYIDGFKNITFDDIETSITSRLDESDFVQPFVFNTKEFLQEEFKEINNIISLLSKNVFSAGLVSAIVKSVLVYQYLQAEVLEALQKQFAPELAEIFLARTKMSIKEIVDTLQNTKLI